MDDCCVLERMAKGVDVLRVRMLLVVEDDEAARKTERRIKCLGGRC